MMLTAKEVITCFFPWIVNIMATFLFLILLVRLLPLHDKLDKRTVTHHPKKVGDHLTVSCFYNICMLEGEKCSVMNLLEGKTHMILYQSQRARA